MSGKRDAASAARAAKRKKSDAVEETPPAAGATSGVTPLEGVLAAGKSFAVIGCFKGRGTVVRMQRELEERGMIPRKTMSSNCNVVIVGKEPLLMYKAKAVKASLSLGCVFLVSPEATTVGDLLDASKTTLEHSAEVLDWFEGGDDPDPTLERADTPVRQPLRQHSVSGAAAGEAFLSEPAAPVVRIDVAPIAEAITEASKARSRDAELLALSNMLPQLNEQVEKLRPFQRIADLDESITRLSGENRIINQDKLRIDATIKELLPVVDSLAKAKEKARQAYDELSDAVKKRQDPGTPGAVHWDSYHAAHEEHAKKKKELSTLQNTSREKDEAYKANHQQQMQWATERRELKEVHRCSSPEAVSRASTSTMLVPLRDSALRRVQALLVEAR
eukprot:TRINITY_DN23437_c0_g1_i1.p1 TRINITY_DN23437_c0_g1~~TRINITY_DN23437_c0_g1_i1.p1  ORF type:complete len:409 (+),score=90.49 TRINITY_DN23437_c0_g1_i1:58-1227(+)